MPASRPAASRKRSGTCTCCRPTPSQPRAMRPSVSSGSSTRSMVAAGIASARRRGPAVDMPISLPPSVSTAPPSSAPSRASSRSSVSMRPPAWLCHSGPVACTMPRRPVGRAGADRRRRSGRASRRAGRASAAGSAAPSFCDRRSTATLVPGSRPARRAGTSVPSRTTVKSVASGSICSDVTTTSSRHRMPLQPRRPVRMATTKVAAASRSASASENCSS